MTSDTKTVLSVQVQDLTVEFLGVQYDVSIYDCPVELQRELASSNTRQGAIEKVKEVVEMHLAVHMHAASAIDDSKKVYTPYSSMRAVSATANELVLTQNYLGQIGQAARGKSFITRVTHSDALSLVGQNNQKQSSTLRSEWNKIFGVKVLVPNTQNTNALPNQPTVTNNATNSHSSSSSTSTTTATTTSTNPSKANANLLSVRASTANNTNKSSSSSSASHAAVKPLQKHINNDDDDSDIDVDEDYRSPSSSPTSSDDSFSSNDSKTNVKQSSNNAVTKSPSSNSSTSNTNIKEQPKLQRKPVQTTTEYEYIEMKPMGNSAVNISEDSDNDISDEDNNSLNVPTSKPSSDMREITIGHPTALFHLTEKGKQRYEDLTHTSDPTPNTSDKNKRLLMSKIEKVSEEFLSKQYKITKDKAQLTTALNTYIHASSVNQLQRGSYAHKMDEILDDIALATAHKRKKGASSTTSQNAIKQDVKAYCATALDEVEKEFDAEQFTQQFLKKQKQQNEQY